jgi:hypothetical protein
VDPQAQPDAQGWGISVITSGEIQKSRAKYTRSMLLDIHLLEGLLEMLSPDFSAPSSAQAG